MGVIVGVCVAHTPVFKHAALRIGSQSVGQFPISGNEHTEPAHWQQSLEPRVGVGLGVGVCVAHMPAARQAALRMGSHCAGHAPMSGNMHTEPAHWQQSLGPRVGVGVGAGVLVAHVPAVRQAAPRTGSHSAGHPPLEIGRAHV